MKIYYSLTYLNNNVHLFFKCELQKEQREFNIHAGSPVLQLPFCQIQINDLVSLYPLLKEK